MAAQFTTKTGSATRVPLERVPVRNSGVAAVGKTLRMLHRFAPHTAGNIAETLFFSPRRLPLPIRYEHLLDEADSYTQIQLGAVTIPVYSWGYGPVVLMVHGWSSGGIQFGAFVQPLVCAGYRVVVFDAPGHGRAQGRRSSLYEMTEAVTKVAASVGPIDTIIAHSLGSLAAARAVVDGVQAQRLVLLAPPRDLDSVVAGFGGELGFSEAMVTEHRRRMEQAFGAQVWQQFSFATLAPDLAPRGLVVIDRDDRSVPASHSDQVHLQWAGSERMQTQGLGHNKLLWHPSVLERIQQFMATAG